MSTRKLSKRKTVKEPKEAKEPVWEEETDISMLMNLSFGSSEKAKSKA
jgi:hypothetical protein